MGKCKKGDHPQNITTDQRNEIMAVKLGNGDLFKDIASEFDLKLPVVKIVLYGWAWRTLRRICRLKGFHIYDEVPSGLGRSVKDITLLVGLALKLIKKHSLSNLESIKW